ncbi:MAG: acetate--CoA ligase family protein [Candidatus Micrarchaeota archaeon]|nr:acetate--CoA ligase family protein [Candidatus Micrarchaeota archaeon]
MPQNKFSRLETIVFPELKEYGIELIDNVIIENKNDLKKGLELISLPCYAKLIAREELHKSDKGLVREITNEKECIMFFEEMENLNKEKKVYSFVLQRRVKGVELFLGIKKDNLFGHVLLFGFGGIFVEVYRDIAYAVLPIKKDEFLELVEQTKIGERLLKGYRGYGIDLEKLYEVIKNSYRLMKQKNYSEIEYNPIIVSKEGITSIVDIKIVK